jgi:hypothetical protein
MGSYAFDEDKKLLIADVKGVGKFRYDRDGNFVDAGNLNRPILAHQITVGLFVQLKKY